MSNPPDYNGKAGFKALEYWLMHLPFTDHCKAAGIIYKVLHNLRKEPLPQARWFELLQRFDLAIDNVVLSARMEILNLDASLQEKHLRSQEIDQLQQELASCYADILHQFNHGTKLPLALVANAAFRAIYHLSELQKWSYQLYSQVPQKLWDTTYRVYRLVQHLQLGSYPFAAPNSTEQCATLEDIYKQLLLLAAANTSRMQSHEIITVSQCITSWAGHVELDKWQGQENVYLFDLNSSQGPQWRGNQKISFASDEVHSLDLTNLNIELMRLAHILARIPDGQIDIEGKIITRSLVQRLLQAWHNKPVRQSERQHVQHQERIKLYLDLDKQAQGDLNIADWRVINASHNGYCLAKQGDIPSDLQVGKWLRVQDPNHESKMGIIRWLHHDVSQGVQLGIQLFDEQAVSVDTLVGDQAMSYPAWVMSTRKHSLNPDAIVIANDHKTGEIVEVQNQEERYLARIGEKLEHSQIYSQYQIYPVSRDH